MLLSSGSFLKAPYSLTTNPSNFLNGSTPLLRKLHITSFPSPPPAPSSLSIQAMKKLQGRVVCATSDKTVAVEVIRLAPHPKYKRRVRKKKKYQAHDPDNKFKVGDFVQLEQSRPISKTKTFIAIPVPSRNAPKTEEPLPSSILNLPLQSQGKSPIPE
ncbi:30S ribosomal protein S17, chloroplastic [Dendrobium catenatum]|uniref:Small ribosomal subunit protein uS17c n=1 Tax=Dendrobium catenatum TaxID=906689 RepID=A0A2I0VKD5_9ASPA|nr:30S ribosomal protein S17, chloroplastic [Dendrobium catenatum]XP_020699799.1 30S ribosomal protein S17, chloroplastic [Dendrobium catenatum]XP_028556936.1 30S ribosomal protein S17, chloroplastic [Dendrobium catenatum]PKU63876.1 30S ribosomal protein S17, chloroplastic [Dendrobium catenatum]